MPALPHSLRVFLCHGSADKAAVRDLYRRLVADGVDAWLDVEKLLPGQNWQEEIPKAVLRSHVVVVCLSENSVNKEGYVQKEIKLALDKADEMPADRIFLIPARLDHCDVPFRLSQFQWVDLFEEQGYNRLMKALETRADQIRAITLNSKNTATDVLNKGTQVGKAERLELMPKSLLPLGDTTYFVQELVVSQNLGKMIIQGAHASDQVMQEDVSILHIALASNHPNPQMQMARLHHRAQNLNKAASHCPYVPVIRRILPPQERDLWMISQWVKGLPLSKHYPAEGPLPNRADLNQLLGWTIDICDALATLHKLREVHGGVSENAIVTKKGFGAVLIDPAFAGTPLAWKLSPVPFDPRIDIKALGNVLYRIITHQAAGREPIRQFNIAMPAELETLIAKTQEGYTGHVLELKHALIQIRKKARS